LVSRRGAGVSPLVHLLEARDGDGRLICRDALHPPQAEGDAGGERLLQGADGGQVLDDAVVVPLPVLSPLAGQERIFRAEPVPDGVL
jgi:hypothetical protein